MPKMPSPLIMLVAAAVVSGGLSTLLVVVAISVDAWQEIYFTESELRAINSSTVRIELMSSSTQLLRITVAAAGSVVGNNATDTVYWIHSSSNGLWRTCDHLSDTERSWHAGKTVTEQKCYVFVTDYDEEAPSLVNNNKGKQIARLHNSAASCYIVVLIDLASAIVVGLIGILQKQVASCMITGVLYCMAALFGVFGLAMFHTKNYYEKYECYSLDPLPDALCPARNVELMYAIPLAWLGVIFCLFACFLWLVFARALRVIMAKTML